jgi:hypothetical protein
MEEDEMGGHLSRIKEKRRAYMLVVGKTKGRETIRKTKT